MSNSPLIDMVMLSPNYSSRNGNTIKGVTLHHTAGVLTAKQIGNIFIKKSRNASCNYGIGNDGKIVLIVDENNRSWCSSNRKNDENMITFEISNCSGAPNWEVGDLAMDSTIRLLVDICQRNGIKQLKFLNDSSKKYNYDEQNMTLHCWFASTQCPGQYLKGKMSYIANEVNKRLNGGVIPTPTPQPAPTEGRVKVTCTLPMIKKGSKGSAVKTWQTIIGVTADGDFGSITDANTRKFQSTHLDANGKKLYADGIVGSLTWAAGLNSLS